MVASQTGWQLLTAVWHPALSWCSALSRQIALSGHLTSFDRPGVLLAGAAAAVALLLAAALANRAAARPAGNGCPLAAGGTPPELAPRDGSPRYTDPDAPGRARPRAPCAALAAAAEGCPAC